MDFTRQEDLLIVIALTRLSYQFRDSEPAAATRAWQLAIAIAAEHHLEPAAAVFELDLNKQSR